MSLSETAAQHPSTVAATTGGTLVVGLVWFAGNVWPKVPLSAEAGAGIVAVVAPALGFMARNGLAGVWRILRYGSSAVRSSAGQTVIGFAMLLVVVLAALFVIVHYFPRR